jgi:hypothetical protein
VVRLVERPRLEVCVPRHYRVVDAIGAISPGLLHRLVSWQSTPHGTPRGTATRREPPPR